MSVFMYMHDCERERERLCVFIVPSIIPIGRKVGDVPRRQQSSQPIHHHSLGRHLGA